VTSFIIGESDGDAGGDGLLGEIEDALGMAGLLTGIGGRRRR